MGRGSGGGAALESLGSWRANCGPEISNMLSLSGGGTVCASVCECVCVHVSTCL